jgi:hypothetical protein
VRKILRERSRNSNREVWESPSVYGGEDVKVSCKTFRLVVELRERVRVRVFAALLNQGMNANFTYIKKSV